MKRSREGWGTRGIPVGSPLDPWGMPRHPRGILWRCLGSQGRPGHPESPAGPREVPRARNPLPSLGRLWRFLEIPRDFRGSPGDPQWLPAGQEQIDRYTTMMYRPPEMDFCHQFPLSEKVYIICARVENRGGDAWRSQGQSSWVSQRPHGDPHRWIQGLENKQPYQPWAFVSSLKTCKHESIVTNHETLSRLIQSPCFRCSEFPHITEATSRI